MIDAIDHEYVSNSISKVMVGNNCHPTFEFTSLSLPTVEGYLWNFPNCKTSGVDNFDSYLLNIASEIIKPSRKKFYSLKQLHINCTHVS